MFKIANLLPASLVVMFLAVGSSTVAAENLAPNPGFEKMDKDKISGWNVGRRILKGSAEVDKDVKHSGAQSLHIKSVSENLKTEDSPYGGISALTDYLSCPPPGTILKCSAWVKTENVRSSGKWYKCRFVIYFFDKDKGKLKHYDIFSGDGSLDWQRCSAGVTVPEKASYMKLGCALTHCSGDAWFDDIEIKIDETSLQRKEAMTNLPTGQPILIPTPKKAVFGKKSFAIGNVLLKTLPDDKRCNAALMEMLKGQNVKIDSSGVEIVFCDKASGQEVFKSEFSGNKWEEMGEQGYFLIAKNNKIVLGSNTEQGRFYALQTLRQLLRADKGKIREVSILDWPTVDKRGVVIGLQWFSKKEEAIRRMAQLKMNLVWHQGSFLNLKLGCNHKTLKTYWRTPFTEKELNTVRKYLEICKKNFIEVCVSFSPRGLPQTHYSSQKDIDLLVGKMEALYKLGVRGLGINFDDLQNIEQDKLFYKDDIEKFDNHLGMAQAYFVEEVYKKLKKTCPDVVFAVLPYAYGGIVKMPEKGKKSKEYLRRFSKLTPEIKRWVVCLYSKKDVDLSKKITGRKPFIWDNYYTTGQLAAFPSPINRPNTLDNGNIAGYMFLPATPKNEDASKISWLNAADYEWAPCRYKPMESYKNAIAFVAGSKEAAELLQEYSKFSLKIDDYKFPTESKAKRAEFLKKILARLDSFPERLKILQPDLAKALNDDIVKYKKNLKRILDNLGTRSYPGIINKKENFAASSENVFDNFIPLKKNKDIEDTKLWLSYDKDKLYLKVLCDEPNMNKLVAKRKERDSNVFQDDSIEIFIMPDPEDSTGNSTYYQIVVNSKGAVYDSKYIHKRFNYLHDQFKDWTAHLDIKTVKNKDSWALDVAIPFKDLGMVSPEKGRRIFMNVCRNRYAGGKVEYSCYSLLLKGKFHDPMSFWPMEFK